MEVTLFSKRTRAQLFAHSYIYKFGLKYLSEFPLLEFHTSWLSFNQPKIPKEVKIRYCSVNEEKYILAPSMYFKCQKNQTTRRKIVSMKLNVLTVKKITPLSHDLCDIHKIVREILEVKYKRNATFFETKRIKGFFMGENTYASVAPKVNPIVNNN